MELSTLPALELLNATGNEIAAVDCVLPSVRRLLLDDNRLTAIPRGVLHCRRLQVKLSSLTSNLKSYTKHNKTNVRQLQDIVSRNFVQK